MYHIFQYVVRHAEKACAKLPCAAGNRPAWNGAYFYVSFVFWLVYCASHVPIITKCKFHEQENKKQDSAPPDVGLTSSLSELADKGKDVVKDGLQGPTKINEMVYERRTMEEK